MKLKYIFKNVHFRFYHSYFGGSTKEKIGSTWFCKLNNPKLSREDNPNSSFPASDLFSHVLVIRPGLHLTDV